MGFKMNPGWEKEIARLAQPALKEFAEKNQPKMDSLLQRYSGRPVAEIKPLIKREMDRWGGSLSGDAELTKIATAISKGRRVVLRPPK